MLANSEENLDEISFLQKDDSRDEIEVDQLLSAQELPQNSFIVCYDGKEIEWFALRALFFHSEHKKV